MTDFNKIKELNQKIAELIAEKPDLKKLQDEIDSKTKGLSAHNRQQVILSMMVERREKLISLCMDINDLCKNTSHKLATITPVKE